MLSTIFRKSIIILPLISISILADNFICESDPIYMEYLKHERVDLDGASLYDNQTICQQNCRDYSQCSNVNLEPKKHFIGVECSDDNFYFKYTQISPLYMHTNEKFEAILEGSDSCQGSIEPSFIDAPNWINIKTTSQDTLEKYTVNTTCSLEGTWNSKLCLSAVGDNLTSTKCEDVLITCCIDIKLTIKWILKLPLESVNGQLMQGKIEIVDDECDKNLNNDTYYLENNPSWLSIDNDGTIKGTPTSKGILDFNVCVKDTTSNSCENLKIEII